MRNLLALPTILVIVTVGLAQVESLPAPVVNSNSFEIVANSRYSAHSGSTSALPRQVLANVLWTMARAPALTSAYREYYIATPENVYTYDPVGHVLNVHLAGNHRYSSNSAFEVGIAVERPEDAGLAIEAGLLAGVAFWSRGSGSVALCPMAYAANHANSNWSPAHTIQLVNVYWQGAMNGLTDSCVARSSDSTLPRPQTDGADTFEIAAADLRQDTVFAAAALTLDELSQVLWAGYGVTPHMPIGKRGLTVPSAVAYYYLTRRIYVAADTALFRYHNRLPPGTNLSTSDHRLELLVGEDRRAALRAACPRLPPTAAAYIVLSVADTTNSWQTLEPGFAAYHYLVQSRILGFGGHILAPLSTSERTAIQSALDLPTTDYPVLVFSAGHFLTGAECRESGLDSGLAVRAVTGRPVRIEYSLAGPGPVDIVLRDLAGRQVRSWTETHEAAGRYSTVWSGSDDRGNRVSAGVYVCRVSADGGSASLRIVLAH